MVKLDEFAFLDATAQAELVRRRKLKPIELAEAAIERIEHLNPVLNAVVTPMYEPACTAARGKLPEGAFRGVPFLLKDLLACYAGVRMTSGSVFLRNFVPDYDSELVVRLKRAGLVILGKTNTPEFGLMATTEPRLFGPTCNPWDTERTTGGSSGGSAAAVAAGLVPMAHGNDLGGSIRIPASCCGLFGLKPTRGRNPLGPDYADMLFGGRWTEHALTRSVRDSAALLDATSVPETGAPYWAPPPARPFRDEVGAAPGRLRIAFTTKASGVTVHDDCVRAVREAAALCLDLGHELEEAVPVVDEEVVTRAFATLASATCAGTIEHFARITGRTPTPEQFEPRTWNRYEMGRQCQVSDYLLAVSALQKVAGGFQRFFLDYDVWLTPTLSEPPVPLGTFQSRQENLAAGMSAILGYVVFTRLTNITGQPAMSVPLFWNADDLPIGVHFTGRFGDEATLFRLAAQLEAARPWASRRPPVSA